METKSGGRTIAIDGCPVGAGGREYLRRQADRAALKAAEGTLARARELLHEDPGVEQPDRQATRLAEFSASVGTRLLGGKDAPAVKWFDPGSERPGRRGYVQAGWRTIRLRSDLRGEALASTALHETKHISQDAAGELDRSDSEATAEHFGKRWASAVHAAYRWTKGDVRLVHLSARRRPSFRGTYRRGDVVLSTPTARVWAYTPQNLNTWSAIG